MNALKRLKVAGQTCFLDYISRDIIQNGDLEHLIELGLGGVTSNPTIFEKAISGSPDYVESIRKAVSDGLSADKTYETILVQDIREGADLLSGVYDRSGGHDGFVSLEVSPELAHDKTGTIAEAVRLWSLVDRPNLMIKVPATEEGLGAITELVRRGLNINVTLIFSAKMYRAVADAYIDGLTLRLKAGDDIGSVASVASVFISRVDGALDPMLEEKGLSELKGKTAIANAKMIYQDFKNRFSGPEWEALSFKGARVQRPLWASTSTKNPSFPDTMYVDALVGANTVNTLPRKTLDALLDHGGTEATLERDLDLDASVLEQISESGINLDDVTDRLLVEGLESFAKSYQSLLECVGGACIEMA